jgi:hypothetical protein
MDTILIIVGVIIVAGIVYKISQVNRQHEDGRIDGNNISKERLVKILSGFTPKKISEKYTEKSIQKELGALLKDSITLVKDEYGLEGLNGRKIDFNIGNSKNFGIEVKVAKSFSKQPEWDRFQSQLKDYLTHYKDNNLILFMFGTENEKKETIIYKIDEFCKKNQIYFIYGFIKYN